jgi:hypothetical protein
VISGSFGSGRLREGNEFALNNCHPIDFMMQGGGFSRTDLQGFV